MIYSRQQLNSKSDDEDGYRKAFHRESGMVEARQMAAEHPIPSELSFSKAVCE